MVHDSQNNLARTMHIPRLSSFPPPPPPPHHRPVLPSPLPRRHPIHPPPPCRQPTPPPPRHPRPRLLLLLLPTASSSFPPLPHPRAAASLRETVAGSDGMQAPGVCGPGARPKNGCAGTSRERRHTGGSFPMSLNIAGELPYPFHYDPPTCSSPHTSTRRAYVPPSQLEFLLNKWSPFSTQIHRIEVSSAQISTFELSFLFHLFYSCGSS
ncbi:hypothetical protein PVAP13_4KG326925 [Panicum virgatum]|uniref:Uncharacterized protein n=1 Tax=Panicum virgatum TaxID=38727 RepID=A0A8T0TVY5_PANVG|nr:hypothetical protein PVAP13_4KG326925 [Panicum virgatum]